MKKLKTIIIIILLVLIAGVGVLDYFKLTKEKQVADESAKNALVIKVYNTMHDVKNVTINKNDIESGKTLIKSDLEKDIHITYDYHKSNGDLDNYTFKTKNDYMKVVVDSKTQKKSYFTVKTTDYAYILDALKSASSYTKNGEYYTLNYKSKKVTTTYTIRINKDNSLSYLKAIKSGARPVVYTFTDYNKTVVDVPADIINY